ncbi:MAG: sugar ABC transporter permease [Acidothermaceae bacterium]
MTTPESDEIESPSAAKLHDRPGSSPTEPSHDAGVVGASGFTGDAGQTTLMGAARAYVAKVRGGEPGALPAIFGLVVLLIVFSQMSKVFLTTGNLANLPGQAGPTILIGMGVVFVLLVGEIDLSAGTAGGVCAMLMALVATNGGDLNHAIKGGSYWAVVIVVIAGLAVAVWQRLWPATVIVGLGLVVVLTHIGGHVWIAMFLAISAGTAIGCVTGYLVARVGIPSFIVTLAFFLAWQGVIISFAGKGGAISMSQFYPVIALAHRNVNPTGGWIIFVVFVGGYGAYTLYRSIKRRSQGLSAEPLSLVLVRFGVLAAVGAFVVVFLNRNRQVNKGASPVIGMPWVVPLILVLLVAMTLLLTKTAFGRYLYAVGGNAEAARRAGIDVRRMRIAAFAISSTLAAFGGLALASYGGGVALDIGGSNTLLYAVGAAVVGGTSLFGGRGRVRDALLGGIVISLIPNGLGLKVNINAAYLYIITGAFLLLAAAADAFGRRRQSV